LTLSFLTTGAVICTPTAEFPALNAGRTAEADLAFPIIDLQSPLILARTAEEIPPVGNARSPAKNRLFEDAAGRRGDPSPFDGGDIASAAPGTDGSSE